MRESTATMASIHHYFARKQVGNTQKRGKPEMRSSCRNSIDLHWSPWPRPGRGSASVPHLRYLSVAILMNRRHWHVHWATIVYILTHDILIYMVKNGQYLRTTAWPLIGDPTTISVNGAEIEKPTISFIISSPSAAAQFLCWKRTRIAPSSSDWNVFQNKNRAGAEGEESMTTQQERTCHDYPARENMSWLPSKREHVMTTQQERTCHDYPARENMPWLPSKREHVMTTQQERTCHDYPARENMLWLSSKREHVHSGNSLLS